VSRGRYIALGVIACLVGGGIVVWQAWPRDDPARATVEEAVERFRERAAASGEGPGGAASGVYRYRTTGSETADTDLLSATHDYDGISTIIISRSDCGVLERWQVLAGRWTEADFCVPPDGSGLRRVTEFHEFFGRDRENTYRCRGRAPSRRLLRTVGTKFSSRCSSGDNSANSVSRVVDVERIEVAGESIDAIHTVSDVVLDGDVAGSTTREDWRRREDGLLLRRVVETDAEMSGAISADYAEEYTIELLSTRPQR
jgi:hypothetical protein